MPTATATPVEHQADSSLGGPTPQARLGQAVAIVIGVLLMKNVKPGPEIFEKQAALVYSICLIFLLANLVLIPVGFLAVKAGGYVVRVSRRLLLPVILLFFAAQREFVEGISLGAIKQ